MPQNNTTITITTGTIIKTILILALCVGLFYVRNTVILVLTSVVIAASVEPFANWFVKRRVPRVIAVLLIYVAALVLIAATFYFILLPLLNEASSFISSAPEQLSSAHILSPIGDLFGGAGSPFIHGLSENFSLGDIATDFKQLSTLFSSGGFVNTVSTIFGGVFSTILIFILSFYLAVQHDGVIQFLKTITPIRHRNYVLDLWKRSEKKIGLWMQGQLMLSVLIAILTYLGLSLLGVPYALLLAVLSGIFELIPLFGPVVSAILPILIGVSTGGLTLGLLVFGLYVIIQQFENHLIYPLVVRKVVGVPPIIVIIALIVGAQLAGFLGILISVPLAAIFMEFIKDVQKRHLEEEAQKV